MAAAVAIALGGCGGKPEAGNAVEANAAANAEVNQAAVPAPPVPADFNYLNACKLLPEKPVAKAMGEAVAKSELSMETPASADTAGFSTCTYTLADGKTVSLLARWSPYDEFTPQEIKTNRDKQTSDFDLATEDVAKVGDSAYWVPQMSQLNVFAGKRKYLIFTLRGTDEAKAKDRAIALARVLKL